MKKKAVVLLSGGLDSATCLYWAIKKGLSPYCLIIDYNQRHKKELIQARRLAKGVGVRFTVCKIDLAWKGSSLLDKKQRLPQNTKGIPSTYVPARNSIFLSLALSYAEVIGAKAVVIGANARDFSGYPDCRPVFYRAFRSVARAGLKNKQIRVLTPLINKSKCQIVQLARKLSVPLQLTWSCYAGGKRPCGVCDSCRFRAKGFEQAKVKDPAV